MSRCCARRLQPFDQNGAISHSLFDFALEQDRRIGGSERHTETRASFRPQMRLIMLIMIAIAGKNLLFRTGVRVHSKLLHLGMLRRSEATAGRPRLTRRCFAKWLRVDELRGRVGRWVKGWICGQ